MKHRLIAALAIVAIAAPAASQTMLDKLIQRVTKPKAKVPATRADPTTPVDAGIRATTASALDVAGVRLGMSPDDARAALTRAGYRIGENIEYGPSFASRVRAEAERRRTGSYASASMVDRALTGIEATGTHRESIVVGLAAVAAGSSVVTGVRLVVPSEVMKGSALLQQAVAKYGQPDGARDGRLTLAWCSAPMKPVCGSILPFQAQYGSLPNLEASTIVQNSIRLSEGTERGREREREFAAAVDLAAPKSDRVAF